MTMLNPLAITLHDELNPCVVALSALHAHVHPASGV
jgi:hypothetical protein